MTSNAEAAEIFGTIADLLDLLGEKFKPEAYRRAARSIESLTEDLGTVAKRGELRSIPGVGEAIAEKIEEYLRSGSISYYERLKREIPPGLVELMRLPGLGPKTARRFWVDLGIEGPNELRDAIAAGRLDGLKGFGAKKIDQFRSALVIEAAGPGPARRPIEEVYPVAQALVVGLRSGANVDRVEVAGSFRRSRETVGDLDILVTSKDPPRVFEVFTALPPVGEVKMRGETKETVLLKGGLQVDLRVVQPEEFGAALVYFTGSKDHNVHLRSLARDRGLKVNEYGVFRGEERVAGATEKDVYASLGLAWIPPELREDHGEIDAAAGGTIPSVVEDADLRGDLHVHLSREAEPGAIDALVATAEARRFSYLGVVVGGVSADGPTWSLPATTRDYLRELRPRTTRVIAAVETGPGPLSKGLENISADYRILRPVGGSAPVAKPTGEATPTLLVAHLGLSTATASTALSAWLAIAREQKAAVEVGPGPERLDPTATRAAREAGVRLHLATGVAEPSDDPTRWVALGFARRAGTSAREVENARPLSELRIGGSVSGLAPPQRSRGPPKRRPGPKGPA
jgi:DNA polymerase/3'-5' exonuclease PolX